MGTTYSVQIVNNLNYEIEALQTQIDSILNNVNSIASTYIDDSEIMYLNNMKSIQPVQLSDELFFLIRKSIDYYDVSDGYYDVSVGPLVDLWGFGRNKDIYSTPSLDQIDSVMRFVGLDKLQILDGTKISKKEVNLSIDLSSIAKGYGVDMISNYLENCGFENFLVDIGGELSAKGLNNNESWSIGIQNPQDFGIIKKIELNNKSIATSGTYINYNRIDSTNYPHIINPRKGCPVPNHIISATVIADKCVDADAIATMIIALGDKRMIDVLDRIEDIDYYIIIGGKDRVEAISSFD